MNTKNRNELIEDFPWIELYEKIADQLLQYRHNRKPLVERLHDIAARVEPFMSMTDKDAEGSLPLRDIDPFTTIASFNRRTKSENRIQVAIELAEFLGVDMDKQRIEEAIYVLGDRRSVPEVYPGATWFFAFAKNREANDIDTLWNFFERALEFADSATDESRKAFTETYDEALKCKQIGDTKLSMGLYWIRPRSFQNLDNCTCPYIENVLDIPIQSSGPKGRNADDYLALLSELETRFKEDAFPVHSFPELSWTAWWRNETVPKPIPGNDTIFPPYPLNTILYGPPGTGKTYATVRRCVEICEGKEVPDSDNSNDIRARYDELVEKGRIEFITFHQSYGYEEFVEGLRPETSGTDTGFRLEYKDGVLKEIAKRSRNKNEPYVLVIDEINRANVSKVLGELVTLLEEDKRQRAENEISATLPHSGEKFSLPANLFILGTMNTADRSIALLDTALRRRFHFEELPPNPQMLENAKAATGIDLPRVLRSINERIEWLYDRDHLIGHAWLMNAKTREGIDEIMRCKIIPLLAEYFYEDWQKVQAILGGTDDFVRKEKLNPPPGLENEGDKRYRWTIRERFGDDAYTRLIKGNPDQKPTKDDVAD